ncbi:nicotinate-nucleotide pyrophosphorylase (carboxylating) [Candidatus Planktophila limnetica]|uniref:Nicotinate-nucleotide pyrophosphorylase [carboxylating] n=1 Tax=Candidatus Planktophila limnetica TaxID=573600 RepID=A0A249LH90_9ACTN|nr:carboxylating nicotinate-nucleotide diphosphorylase [Candidatus Planktophila limnetica]ASY28245.1 nicotinate-nucleotide pyrophosphorylase (carboxylating) [Candidatus Planktophila limnetica]
MIDRELIKRAIAEDLNGGVDITSMATLSPDAKVSAQFVARNEGVIAGINMAIATLAEVGVTDATALVKDGDLVKSGTVLIKVSGNARGILLAERTALNFLGHLSGISTLTSQWVNAVAGTETKIRDTRKTTPGMRALEKYAVRMGGGTNHRLSLSDAALIKDNHIAAAGGVVAAFSLVHEKFPTSEIEIEVDNLQQLRDVLPLKPGLVLLDNMDPEQCAEAVALVAGATKLEASGGITIENARAYAEAGVDYIAVGALTHSAPNFDIGLDMEVE